MKELLFCKIFTLILNHERIKLLLFAKFSQNTHLAQFLLNTEDDIILEASRDKFWGIGKTLRDKDLWIEEKWTGYNLMGKLLMKVRKMIKDTKINS